MISDSIEHQWLADIKPISDRCKTGDGGNRFPVDLRSSDWGSRMARNVMKTHIEEIYIIAGQGAKRLWGRVIRHHLCGTSQLQMRNVNSLRCLFPFFPPMILRMNTCNWKKSSPLPQWESLLHYVCFMFVQKKKSGTLITSKAIVWSWNLWQILVSHLALGTTHLYLNIPVLSVTYCNMFTLLGNIIVIGDRQRHISTRKLKTDVLEWKLPSPWSITFS